MNNSCKVTFYVVTGTDQTTQTVACRLALKAWQQGYHVAVLVSDKKAATSLDDLMWNVPAGRFLPHSKGAADADTPVSIDVHGAEIATDRDLVINLSEQAISEPGRYKRLLEIVPGSAQQREASRQKFRIYRDLGMEPETHNIQ